MRGAWTNASQAHGLACKRARKEKGLADLQSKAGERPGGCSEKPVGENHKWEVESPVCCESKKDTRKDPFLQVPLLKGLPAPEVPPPESHFWELSVALSLPCSFGGNTPLMTY